MHHRYRITAVLALALLTSLAACSSQKHVTSQPSTSSAPSTTSTSTTLPPTTTLPPPTTAPPATAPPTTVAPSASCTKTTIVAGTLVADPQFTMLTFQCSGPWALASGNVHGNDLTMLLHWSGATWVRQTSLAGCSNGTIPISIPAFKAWCQTAGS